jgi:hypothetical protein
VVTTLGRRPAQGAGLAMHEPGDAEDEQLSLFLLQQLSYRPIVGVDPAWEDDLTFLVLRERLEQAMEDRLGDALAVPDCEPAGVPEALLALIDEADGPSLSGWLTDNGTIEHLREFVEHQSA